jgi:hypothetical protein
LALVVDSASPMRHNRNHETETEGKRLVENKINSSPEPKLSGLGMETSLDGVTRTQNSL